MSSSPHRRWELQLTPQVDRWLRTLDARDTGRIDRVMKRLEQTGPMLGRPDVDSIKGSRHHNMKEIRSRGGNLRVLFAFDPHRRAVLLIGGDKTNDWRGWYARNIPQADRLYDQHLRTTGTEHAWHRSTQRAGKRSAQSSR